MYKTSLQCKNYLNWFVKESKIYIFMNFRMNAKFMSSKKATKT